MPLLLHGRSRRLHPDDRKPDQRRDAQRDRDRVLYTSALRRLGHVTQVVSPTEGIVFHNRLTHTHEVAQIGRRIAERLTADEENLRKARRLGGIDPDVVETAALVHDLGHPPYGHAYGHAVEQELNYLVAVKHGVHDGYEGNAQSFRIVTKLAMRHRTFPGLNLRVASRSSSLSHCAVSTIAWQMCSVMAPKRTKWLVTDYGAMLKSRHRRGGPIPLTSAIGGAV